MPDKITLFNLPIEIVLNICEKVDQIDDLISLYKTCKLFKTVINNYKRQILDKSFTVNEFSNSYYNLFFSFINDQYEYIKPIPYRRLYTLLQWRNYWDDMCIYEKNNNVIICQNNKVIDDYKYEFKFDINKELINYFIELNKFREIFIDDCLPLFKNFMYLLYMPSQYIYNSSILLYKFFNIRGLYNKKNSFVIIIKIQKELCYYEVMNKRNTVYNIGEYSIFEILKTIYPDLIIGHFLNFKKFMHRSKYYRLLHNFIINLFLEWLFENECEFIETIYHKLYLHFPHFVQKTIYRIIYNDFSVRYNVTSDEFVEEFYNIHRIFVPSSKIIRLYRYLNLKDYRMIEQNKNKDWKYHLEQLEIFDN